MGKEETDRQNRREDEAAFLAFEGEGNLNTQQGAYGCERVVWDVLREREAGQAHSSKRRAAPLVLADRVSY